MQASLNLQGMDSTSSAKGLSSWYREQNVPTSALNLVAKSCISGTSHL